VERRTVASPKLILSRGPIPKPNYLPHPSTQPTYHPKPHQYQIGRFFDITPDRQMVGGNVRWTSIENRRPTDRVSTFDLDFLKFDLDV